MQVSEAALRQVIAAILEAAGCSAANALTVATVVAAAERDGGLSHGLLRLPGYVETLRSGWIDGQAVPVVRDAAPGLIAVDGRRGFAQVALAAVREAAVARARSQGVVSVCLSDTHHFAALWPDVEPFAEQGLVALTMVNARPWMAAWGSPKKVLGTNPMAFACPRAGAPPIVWDQASSLRAQGEVLLARREGREVAPGTGLDATGEPTTDPAAILDGGALLPFGAHKGAGLAFMVEVMAAALTGGRFGFEDRARDYPGAQTTQAGQFLLLVDPAHVAGASFSDRIEALLAHFHGAGVDRLPADARYRRRAEAATRGIPISDAWHRTLVEMAGAKAAAVLERG